MSISTTVAAVVDGKHEDGETVTLAGHATSPLAINFGGSWHDTFLLISEIRPRKAIRIEITSLDRAQSAALLESAAISEPAPPPLVEVTGSVTQWETAYFIVANEIKAVAR